MSAASSTRGWPGLLGNLAVLLALFAFAAWFLALQSDAAWAPSLRGGRGPAALACATAYVGFVAWTLWSTRPGKAMDNAVSGDAATTLVAWASQTGFAQQLAERTAQSLRDAGLPVRLLPLDRLDAAALAASGRALFVASTTGEGDPPDHALGFVRKVMGQPAALHSLRYAVLALGDREYDNF